MALFAEKTKVFERQGKRVIHLEIGEPDFDTPLVIRRAAINSLRLGDTHYGNALGLTALRSAIAKNTQERHGFLPDLNQIIVAPGLSLVYFTLRCLTNPGDEVIAPDPGFTPYYSLFNFLGLRPVAVPLKESEGFELDPRKLEERISQKTKIIIINSPQNPTGAVISKSKIQAIAKIAQRYDIPLLSDEVYSQILYGGRYYSPGSLDGCRRGTIILDSFSKAYAMTGWRLGYLIAPEELIKRIGLLIENTIYSVPDFIQKAGVEALRRGRTAQKTMVREYRKRRDVLVSGLNQLPGIRCLLPQGAFYAFPNVSGTGFKSEAFVNFMLERAQVALLPGNLFGREGEGYVRAAFTVSVTDIKEGLRRMHQALMRHG